MLLSLSIRDVVLIDQLDLTFDTGLGVLTGETGAGKSILLDALGLTLGARADSSLVRHGSSQATVTATFDIADLEKIQGLLIERGIKSEEDFLILRRVLTAEGKSKSFINDQNVSLGLLKQFGESLVEVHGQFESQRLMNPSNHRGLLDSFGDYTEQTNKVSKCWFSWRKAIDNYCIAEKAIIESKSDLDYLTQSVEELNRLSPVNGEEDFLASQRTMLMHGETLIDAMTKALSELNNANGVEETLRIATHRLEVVAEKADGRLDDVIATLERAAIETSEGISMLEKACSKIDLDPENLEIIEERLFSLRAQARKHNIAVDGLADHLDKMSRKLADFEDRGQILKQLHVEVDTAKKSYVNSANKLTDMRIKAARKLDEAMRLQLGPLKMNKAEFITDIRKIEETSWGALGFDQVNFTVSINPGVPPGSLNKIASGGEISRFMLALKVVLASSDAIPTIIFDEVDSGVGGAVAAAVGERLVHLSNNAQVLVVTHSPQVASRGTRHWRVSKLERVGQSTTSIETLNSESRKEEIARMLAGAEVTEEARAAAESLLQEKISG